ncbi:DEAD/DEAH box helicase [Haloarchaeobius sp. FL176]|uniref:DEAD/DEAH box helicase n=1 Tax=Haloarchaeobius sp. FL176 TaxID=2967129 RepID=UPI00214795EE|nr:AAA domain-containing protein [Haloarchaeobius sp. FL176]
MNPYKKFSDWKRSNAELLTTDIRSGEYDPVDVSEAASRANDELQISTQNEGRFVLPLFELDEPAPIREYVYYRPENDDIGCIDSNFGTPRFIDCEKLETNEIGHRLRFWLPSHRPEPEIDIDESKLPKDQVSPIDRLAKTEREQFFQQLRGFVRSERDAEKEANWETYNEVGLESAIHRNLVSGPFAHISKIKAKNGRSAYRFQFVVEDGDEEDVNLRNDEELFEGNYCILDLEGENHPFPIVVELISVGDQTITIQPKKDGIQNTKSVRGYLSQDNTEVWLHPLLNPVPFERRLTAISQVKKSDEKRELLTGQRDVAFSVNEYALPEGCIELNEYQRQALIWATSAEDIVCIHGPPGTGKTRTLTAFVENTVSRGNSVLVTAHSNQAVDNLLVGDSTLDSPEDDTLHEMAQDPEKNLSVARVGSNSRNQVVRTNYTYESVADADIVAATTSGAATFEQNRFDIAVVDEASQASRPATAIALNCARKLVLAGDHKQLPPYCADESMQEEDMHISLFEYLLNRYGENIAVLLRKQYRMHEKIAEFPNQAFYQGELETASRNRDWTVDDLKPIMGVNIQGEEKRQTHGNSYYNPQEAEAVAKQVKLLVKSGLGPEDIGVITAYSGQIRKIRNQIHRVGIDNPGVVTVDTVDSFQGGEREAIIVSFVRSNPDGYSGFLEFPVEGPRRLNVAVTRARKRLVLVGNWDTLGTVAPHRSPSESCADLYAELAEYIQSQGWMLS